MNNPELLSSRIWALRYFLSTNFFGAFVGHRPSYVWRSVCSSMWVLEKACKWIVGDGENIHNWRDPWLSRPHRSKLFQQEKRGAHMKKVAELFAFRRMEGRGGSRQFYPV